MIKLIVGAIIGIATIAFIKQANMLGIQCFYVGNLSMETYCLNPAIYYGLLAVAAIIAILGIVDLLKKNPAPGGER